MSTDTAEFSPGREKRVLDESRQQDPARRYLPIHVDETAGILQVGDIVSICAQGSDSGDTWTMRPFLPEHLTIDKIFFSGEYKNERMRPFQHQVEKLAVSSKAMEAAWTATHGSQLSHIERISVDFPLYSVTCKQQSIRSCIAKTGRAAKRHTLHYIQSVRRARVQGDNHSLDFIRACNSIRREFPHDIDSIDTTDVSCCIAKTEYVVRAVDIVLGDDNEWHVDRDRDPTRIP